MEVEIATYEIIPEWLHCNRISWFAVFEKYRCRGVGSTLLEYAINELGNDKVIEVTTFQESYSEGIPARRLIRNSDLLIMI